MCTSVDAAMASDHGRPSAVGWWFDAAHLSSLQMSDDCIADNALVQTSSEDTEVDPARPRSLGVALAFVVCVGLASGALAGCTPTANRKIGLQTFAAAGASKDTLARIDCIMYRESRYQNAATHLNTNHTYDKGLFQINSIHVARWRQMIGTDYWKTWQNPYLNAKYALSLWRVAGLAPWRGGCLR